AADQLALPHDWVWMHFALSDHRARRYLDAFSPMPPDVRTLLLSNETRLQIHLAPHAAWGIIPDIEKEFSGESMGAGRLAFFLDETHLFTVRHHPMRVVDEVREQAQAGLRLPSPCLTFVRIVEHFIEVVEDRLIRLTAQLDRMEDLVLS